MLVFGVANALQSAFSSRLIASWWKQQPTLSHYEPLVSFELFHPTAPTRRPPARFKPPLWKDLSLRASPNGLCACDPTSSFSEHVSKKWVRGETPTEPFASPAQGPDLEKKTTLALCRHWSQVITLRPTNMELGRGTLFFHPFRAMCSSEGSSCIACAPERLDLMTLISIVYDQR